MDFVHVREDLVHVLEIVDVQDPVDDVPAVENEDFEDEVAGMERNSRTWTSSKKEPENHLIKYLDAQGDFLEYQDEVHDVENLAHNVLEVEDVEL